MKIALIGYGRMGHEIEEIALKRGHSVDLIIDLENIRDLNAENMQGIEAVIEFTSPDAAFSNIKACLELKIPVVSGTTGWLKEYENAAEICSRNGTSFIHSSNFSIGVNLLFMINRELAKQMEHFDYSVSIEEIHHIKKLDAPSGTAITLAEGISNQNSRFKGWCFEKDKSDNMIPVKSVREGTVTGTHTVTWDSETDTISLRHEARNRKGLALGAVIAAEFIYTRKGVFTMNNVLGF
ncbi:MAG: 4-hydroxy-tetrahydrodipicolinate reductase [Bacteroidota bacterium]|nr:4-hydroxy-tetrahydrodipicolinate reductase [Bacteroidota bacterium]